MSPITGKRKIRELKGKSICVACITELTTNVERKINECGEKEVSQYEKRRFLEHLDKD